MAKKVGKIIDKDKLVDAKWAGKRQSKECRLIITEGDSALSFAISGFSVVGREKFGAFPIQGKLPNFRKMAFAKIKKNKIFENLKKIIGLKQDETYKDTSKLRYGHILILTDQDPDGSHIKGLIMNFFQYYWPELLLIDDFIC